jgi:hypothetical protein
LIVSRHGVELGTSERKPAVPCFALLSEVFANCKLPRIACDFTLQRFAVIVHCFATDVYVSGSGAGVVNATFTRPMKLRAPLVCGNFPLSLVLIKFS